MTDGGVVVVVSELSGGAAAMAALQFRFDERESEREKESEGASEGRDARRPLQRVLATTCPSPDACMPRGGHGLWPVGHDTTLLWPVLGLQ